MSRDIKYRLESALGPDHNASSGAVETAKNRAVLSFSSPTALAVLSCRCGQRVLFAAMSW